MKSFIQFILEGAAIGKGSPWATAKGAADKKLKAKSAAARAANPETSDEFHKRITWEVFNRPLHPRGIHPKHAKWQAKVRKSILKSQKPKKSAYGTGHYNKAKDMKQVELYHHGAKTGFDKITHHEHHKQSSKRKGKAGWEGKVTPNDADHDRWIDNHETKRGVNEPFTQGRINHIEKDFSVNASLPYRSGVSTEHQKRTIQHTTNAVRKRFARHYPDYTESKTGGDVD